MTEYLIKDWVFWLFTSVFIVLLVDDILRHRKMDKLLDKLAKADNEVIDLKIKIQEYKDKEIDKDYFNSIGVLAGSPDIPPSKFSVSFGKEYHIDVQRIRPNNDEQQQQSKFGPINRSISASWSHPLDYSILPISVQARALDFSIIYRKRKERAEWRKLEYSLQDKGTWYAGHMFIIHELWAFLHVKDFPNVFTKDHQTIMKAVMGYESNKSIEKAAMIWNRWEWEQSSQVMEDLWNLQNRFRFEDLHPE